MSGAAVTAQINAALTRTPWLDEALARREWRRTLRQLTAGRWPGLFTLFVLALWLPALSVGSYAGYTVAAWRWSFASLAIALCLCGTGAAFLRGSQIWTSEARNHSLENWLISLQRPEAVAVTATASAAAAVLLMSVPALGILALAALWSQVSVWLFLGVAAFHGIAVCAGAALGSASVFLQAKAFPPRLASAGAACLVAAALALWLRIEYVETGWAGPWERHPDRLLFALLLMTPLPHLLGLTAADLWSNEIIRRLGGTLPAGATTALLALSYVAVAAWAIALSGRGFQLLRADPERLSRRPEPVETTAEPGSEYYWAGFRNPIWTREIRTRLRSREAVECIFFASIAIAIGGFFPLFTAGSQLTDPLQTADVARQVFQWLAMTLGAFVTLITPGLTAEAITVERERGTLDLLLTTPLRPREILNGKLLGSVSILALLLSPSLPLFALCTVFHGASLGQVAGVYLALGLDLALCAYFGVTASAIYRQTLYAKCQAYLLSLLAGVFPGSFLWMLISITNPDPNQQAPLVVLSPAAAILGAFVVAILWGHATERLQHSEFAPP